MKTRTINPYGWKSVVNGGLPVISASSARPVFKRREAETPSPIGRSTYQAPENRGRLFDDDGRLLFLGTAKRGKPVPPMPKGMAWCEPCNQPQRCWSDLRTLWHRDPATGLECVGVNTPGRAEPPAA